MELSLLYGVNQIQLENRLRIWHKRITGGNAVSLRLVINGGSGHQRLDELGLAHFVEHIVFDLDDERKGTKKLAAEIEQSGGYVNAVTELDSTVFVAEVPAHKLEKCLELIDVCISDPNFSEEAINKERQIILNELASDDGEFWYKISRRALGDCAINYSGIGTTDTIKRIRGEQIEAFFKNNYVLNKMTLICIGDIEFNVLQDLIIKKIVRLRNNNAPRENYRCPEGREGFVKIKESRVKNSILYGFRVPGYTKQSKEFYILWFLQDYLQDTLFSFVREKGLSYTMSVMYNINNFSGLFQFYIRYIKKGRKAVMKKIEETIENLRNNLIEPDDFEKSKLSIINQYLNYLKDQKELADVYQQYADIYGDIGEIKDDVNKLQSLNPDDIKAVVSRYFIRDRAFVVTQGMSEQISDILWPSFAFLFALRFMARFFYTSSTLFNKILISLTALSAGLIIWLLIERKRLLRLIEEIQRDSAKT